MPRALTPCAQPGCPHLVRPGTTRCPDHAPKPWATSTRRRRLPPRWAKIRLGILDRDGWTCQIHGPRCTRIASEVDHIRPGDDHTPANLQAVCPPCHREKSLAESHATRRHTG